MERRDGKKKEGGKKTDWRWRDGLSRKGCSPMNIPWEFTLNCFWFVYFFQYSALAHTPSVPVLTPRAPPSLPTHPTNPPTPPPPPPPFLLMPPSPHHPPHFHKWCSDVHQTQQWRITISCWSLSTKALYHFVSPPHPTPHHPLRSPLLSPLEISDVKEQMNFQPDIFGGPPFGAPLPVANANGFQLQRSNGSALFRRRAFEPTCVPFASWSGTPCLGSMREKGWAWPRRCTRCTERAKRLHMAVQSGRLPGFPAVPKGITRARGKRFDSENCLCKRRYECIPIWKL